MRVATYVRMSTNKQEQSPAQQRAALEAHAAKHGYEIVEQYSDLGVSGTSVDKRHGFKQMHADAIDGKFDRILCFDRSRFGRLDSLESGRWIAPLREAGVDLETIAEGVSNWNDFGGRVVDAVLAESKHAFAVDLARATTRGLTAKAAEGRGYTGGVTPYGYRRVTTIQGRNRISVLELDATTADIVRRMFDFYVAPGGSLNGVARMLNESGVPCASRGKTWRRNTVERILQNRVYVGDAVWGRRATGKFFTRENGSEIVSRKPYSKRSWTTPIERADAVPAIVDRATFAKAQALMHERKTQTRSKGSTHPLSGLVFCECCGRALHSDGQSKLRCPSSNEPGNAKACSGARVPMQPMFDAVCDGLKDRLTPSALQRLEKAMRAAMRKRDDHRSADMKAGLEARLRVLEAEIAHGANRVLEVPRSLLGEVTKALEQKTAERDRLAAELAAINVSTKKPVDAIGRLIEALRDVRRVLAGADPATANAILRAAGVKIIARPTSQRRPARKRLSKRAGKAEKQPKKPQETARVIVGDLYNPGFNSEQAPKIEFSIVF